MVERALLKTIQSGSKLAISRWRVAACLLVAITFLYNPFLATSSSLGGQRVSHLPSFRATVASSEFLKFKPEEESATAAVADSDVQQTVDFAPVAETRIFRQPDTNEIVHAQLLPSGSLFFRPPPAV